MKYSVKNRFSGDVIFEGEYESLAGCVLDALKKNANLSRADLSRANLSGANLSRADLSGADLSRADLSGADLRGANLYGASLYRADLSGANLCGANLSRANLSRANLSGADLSGANLSGANLSRADLRGANLSGANLSGAKNYEMFFRIGPIGTRTSELIYFPERGVFKTGCFEGTGKELLEKSKVSHKDAPEHFKAYKIAVKALEAMAKAYGIKAEKEIL